MAFPTLAPRSPQSLTPSACGLLCCNCLSASFPCWSQDSSGPGTTPDRFCWLSQSSQKWCFPEGKPASQCTGSPPLSPPPCRDRRLVRSASAVTPAPLDRPWVELGSSSFLPPAGPDARCFVSRQILRKVLQGCRGSMLGTMALAACQFMEEPGMEVQVRESKHPYNNNTNFEVRSKTCGWQDPRGVLRSSPMPRAAPRPPPLPSPSQERASLVPKPGSLYHPVFFPGDLVLMEKVGAQAWGGGWGGGGSVFLQLAPCRESLASFRSASECGPGFSPRCTISMTWPHLGGPRPSV